MKDSLISLTQRRYSDVSSLHSDDDNIVRYSSGSVISDVKSCTIDSVSQDKKTINISNTSKPSIIENNIIITDYQTVVSPVYKRKLTFVSEGPIKSKGITKSNFFLYQSDNILTIVYNDKKYSQLISFPQSKEMELYFIHKNKSNDVFEYNINEVLGNIYMNIGNVNTNKNNVDSFLQGMNEFFRKDKYVSITHKNCCTKFWFVMLISMMILFICGMMLYVIQKKDEASLLMISVVIGVGVVLCGGVVLAVLNWNKVFTGLKYNVIRYLIENAHEHNKYIDDWNKSIFISNGVNVSIPITLDYIMFNLNREVEIAIENIDPISLQHKQRTLSSINSESMQELQDNGNNNKHKHKQGKGMYLSLNETSRETQLNVIHETNE
jgi:hypothetical protein